MFEAIKEYDISNKLNISCFTAAKELYDAHAQTPFDLAILDIEMSSPNGYEIAKQLIADSPGPLVIFVTNSHAYAIRGYGVAYRYLTKPLHPSQLAEALDSAIQEIHANRFLFSVDGATRVLSMDKIYFFEVFNHHTVLHTIDTEYVIRSTLKEILAQLPSGYFGMSHQSYLVNFNHIDSIKEKQIFLTNGCRIPLSRRKSSDFICSFYRYLGR